MFASVTPVTDSCDDVVIPCGDSQPTRARADCTGRWERPGRIAVAEWCDYLVVDSLDHPLLPCVVPKIHPHELEGCDPLV